MFPPSDQPSGCLVVRNAWFTLMVVHPQKKDMDYTPIGGSTTIIVVVYKHFGSSPRLNQNTR